MEEFLCVCACNVLVMQSFVVPLFGIPFCYLLWGGSVAVLMVIAVCEVHHECHIVGYSTSGITFPVWAFCKPSKLIKIKG